LPGFTFTSWFAIVAPAGTPKDIIVRLNAEIVRSLAAPDVREKLVAQGFTIRGTSQDELASITRAQLARYARLMKEAGIKAE
jgi:tripartite-type tricarboxylate transporter receptor subunit TctC